MAMPLDDILKAISRGSGAGAQIARSALQPVKLSGTNRFLSPTVGAGPFASIGTLAAPKPPEREVGPGGAFGMALKALDLGRGLMVSSVKEGIDMAQDVLAGRVGEGEWSPSEWWKQATSHYGFGDLIHDERDWVGGGLIVLSPFTAGVSGLLGAGVLADNIWADRVVGFVGDVALDPLMYMGGFGAFARGLGWQKAARSLGDFAAQSADNLVSMGVAKSVKAANRMKSLADEAALAAEKSQSLTGASKFLLKHTDPLAREVSEQLGLTAGLRMRLPGTHGVGRFMRQDRYIDWAMRQLPKKMGMAEGVAARQLKNVPGYYRKTLGDDLLEQGIKAYRSGKPAERRAAVEALRASVGVNSETLMRVAGQAARSPLEIALPGIGKGAARAGLGAGLITKVTDLPMRTALALTPESVQQKLAVHFQPDAVLREMRKSGDARMLQIALGQDDFIRHARGIEAFFERTVGDATDNAIKSSVRYKVSDAGLTDLADGLARVVVRDADGVVTGLSAGKPGSVQRLWWDNMVPDEIKQLDSEGQRIVARDVAEWQAVTRSHLDDTWPGMTDEMVVKARQEYGAPQRIHEDNLPHMFGRDDYSQIDEFAPTPGGTKKPWLFDAHGRITPASLKNRTWLPGSKVVVENADASAHAARGIRSSRMGKNEFTGADVMADVLADPATGAVFTIKPPDEVGMSIRKQINIAHEKVFGRPMYQNDFSVLVDKWKSGMGRDIKMERFNQRTSDIYPMFKPDDLIGSAQSALDDFAVVDQAVLKFTGKQATTARQADEAQRLAATHVATQTKQSEKIAQLSLKARQADERIDLLNRLVLDLQAEARGMEDELAEFGLTLANLKPTAEQVAKLEGQFGERAQRVILEAEALAARVAQIEESKVAAQRVYEAYESLVRQETDQWLRNVGMDADGLTAASGAYKQAVVARDAAQADYDRLVKRTAHLERQFDSRQIDLDAYAAHVERLTAEAERLAGLERVGEARRSLVQGRPAVRAARQEVETAESVLGKARAAASSIEGDYAAAQKTERELAKKARRWAKTDEEARDVERRLLDIEGEARDAVVAARENLERTERMLARNAPVREADTAAQEAYGTAVKAAEAQRAAERLRERPKGAHHRTWNRLGRDLSGAEEASEFAEADLKAYNVSVAKRQINKTRERAYAVRRESLRNQIKAKREEIAKQEARGPFKTQGPETARRNKIRRAEYELRDLQEKLDEAYKVGVGGQREKLQEAVRVRKSQLKDTQDQIQALRDADPQTGRPERTLTVPGYERGRPEASYMPLETADLKRGRAALRKAEEAFNATQTKKILEQKRRAEELVDAIEEAESFVKQGATRRDSLGKEYKEGPTGRLVDAEQRVQSLSDQLKQAQQSLNNALEQSEARGPAVILAGANDPRLSGSGTLFAVDDWRQPTEGLAEFTRTGLPDIGSTVEDMSPWAVGKRRRPPSATNEKWFSGTRPTSGERGTPVTHPLYPDVAEDTAPAKAWATLTHNEGYRLLGKKVRPPTESEKILLPVKYTGTGNEWTVDGVVRELVENPVEAHYGTSLRDTLEGQGWRFYDEGAVAEEKMGGAAGTVLRYGSGGRAGGLERVPKGLEPEDPIMQEMAESARLHRELEEEVGEANTLWEEAKGTLDELERGVAYEDVGPIKTDHYGNVTGTKRETYRDKSPMYSSDEQRYALVEAEANEQDLYWAANALREQAQAARQVNMAVVGEAKRLAKLSVRERTLAARQAADFAAERLAIRQRVQQIRSSRLQGIGGEGRQRQLFAGLEGGELPRRPPEAIRGVYTSEDELKGAFSEGMENLTQQLDYLALQLRLVTASGTGLAERARTAEAMRVLLRNLRSGVGGTRSMTPDGRMNTWINRLKDFEELDAALEHEAFAAGTRLGKVPSSRQGIGGFNAAYEKATAGLEGLQTRLVEAAGAPVAGRRLKGGKWVPFKLSADDLAERQARVEFMDLQKADYDDLVAKRAQLDADIERAKGLRDEGRVQELKRLQDVVGFEQKHAERALNDWGPLNERFEAAYGQAKSVEDRLRETVESMEQRAQRVGSTLEGYSPEGAGGRTFRDTVHGMMERGGSEVDEATGKTLFDLKAKDRKAAQELLKDAFGASEWGPWRLLSGNEALDRQMLDVINGFARINDPDQFGGNGVFWKGWDKFQTYLKSAMIATPGFVNRNIFGAFFNAWLDGVNLTEIGKSMLMTREVAAYARNNQVSVIKAAKALAKGDPNKWKNYVELLEVGVRGGGQAVNAVELQIGLRNARNLEMLIGQRDKAGRLVPGGKQYSVSWKPWSPRFAPYQSVRSVNSWVEDVIRLGVGMDTMRWGGSVDDALQRIAKSQFDYGELTAFESKWMRRVFPFYTWTRKNVPYQLKQLGAHPEKYNRLLSAKRNLELGTEEEGTVPDYFLEPFGVRLPFGARGATVYSAPDIPFQDLFRYDPFHEGLTGHKGPKKAVLNLLSGASPILKAPLEIAFGKQVFNGIPFTGRYGTAPNSIVSAKVVPGLEQALEAIGWIKRAPDGTPKMRDHHIYFVTNVLPSLGVIRRLWPNEPKYRDNWLRSLISTLGGVSANFNTPKVQSNWLNSQRYDRLDERRDHMDLISSQR